MAPKSEVLKMYKNLGETPLGCLERFRKENPEYEKISMTYLGRLDPMAEGLLLVLAGNTRSREDFLAWDKRYEFEVLWGFKSDTYDILGIAQRSGEIPVKNFDTKIPSILKNLKEKKTQEYPPFSSKPVLGKPLFSWAREGKISEIEVPTRHIKIFSLKHIHTRLVSEKDLSKEISERISLVQGDFRQKEILKTWQEILDLEKQVLISKFVADVSSGTYIRSLANEMGEKLGCGALVFSIKRTRVGEYSLE